MIKWGCLGPIAAIAVLIVAGMAWNMVTGGTETVTMRGEVVIRQSRHFVAGGGACSGVGEFSQVKRDGQIGIQPRGGGGETATLGSGRVSPDGECVFAFSVKVDDAESYTFFAVGMDDIRVQRSMIDVATDALEVSLSWD